MERFKKYIVDPKNDDKKTKHSLYCILNNQIELAENKLKLPIELKKFYNQVGFGFFFNNEVNHFNHLLSPFQLAQINLREDFYEFDPDLEIYDEDDKLIFFKENEGLYLTILKDDNNGKNAIYYFDKKIADSLEEFLIEFDKNPNLIDEIEIE